MTIEQRMEHFESTNRRWRRLVGTIAVLVITAVGIGVAQMNEDELVLRKLVIQDEKGRDRIELSTSFFMAGITHYDTNGKRRIVSDTTPDGRAHTIWSNYDANGKAKVMKILP